MNKTHTKTRFFAFILLLAGLSPFGTVQAAPLEITGGDYTTETLNTALSGYDSLTVNSTGAVNFNLNGTKIGTQSITVSNGTLNWNANSPNNNDYIFDGNITVNSGTELYLNGADPLGNSMVDTGSWRTLNIGGTLRLNENQNKTMRRVTLNLTGGTVTGHEWQYRSNVSVLQATSGDSKFESGLYFRADANAPKITVSKNASLTFSGKIRTEGTVNSLTFDGEGTTIISNTLSGTIKGIDVSKGTLKLDAAIGRVVPLYNVTNGGTLQLGIGDTLSASGNAVTLNIGEGSTLDLNAKASAAGVSNQTGRNMTINLTGATMKNGTMLVFSPTANPTTLNVLASSKTTEISSTMMLRVQGDASSGEHPINVADGDAAVDLLLSGTIAVYGGSSQYLTLTGGGTTKLTGSIASSIAKVTLDASTLQLGKVNALTSGTNLVTNGTTTVEEKTVPTNGTFDLNGFSTTLGQLTGSGAVTNSSSTASTLTLNSASNSNFSGTVAGTGNINFVKNGTGTWTIASTTDWTSTKSFEIQQGTVVLNQNRYEGAARRFMAGTITIGPNGKLTLQGNDALGNASGGSWEKSKLDVNILGTLEATSGGNQTSRYINYNLYGGTMNIKNNGNIFFVNDITTINSRAKYGTEAVTKTSTINGALAVRDGSCVLTLNIEDGQPDTDLHWTGWLKNVAGSGNAGLKKTGAGTLRLTNMSGKTFDHPSGTTVSEGRLILDGASMTGSDVTVAEGASITAVNGSKISKNLIVNGNYELALADVAASNEAVQLTIDGSMTFGANATANINANEVDWFTLNGKTLLSFNSADQGTAALAKLSELLASDPNSAYINLKADGSSIQIGTNFNAIPEPATWVLLILGLAGLPFRRACKR